MTTTQLKPLAIYARVSRANGREGESFHSPKLQRREGKQIADRQGLPVLPDTYLDVNRSGGSFDRPAFNEVLGLIRAGQCGGIIATRLDRISRAELPQAVAMLAEIEEAGGVIYTHKGQVASLLGDDAILVLLELWAASRERRDRGRYANASRKRAVEERSAHLYVTYGYQREGQGSKRLVPREPEASTVREAFRLRGDLGWSWNRIADELNSHHALPRQRKGQQSRWTHKTVSQMIAKQTYLGTAHSGAFVKQGAHEALVTRELWDRANAAAGTGRADLTGGQGYLLSGLVRCSSCGHVMVHSKTAGRRYYRCSSQAASGACPSRVSIPADELEYVASVLFHQTVWSVQPSVVLVESGSDLDHIRQAHQEALAELDTTRRLVIRQELGGAEAGSLDYLIEEAQAKLATAAQAVTDGERQAQGMHLPSGLSPVEWQEATTEERRRWLASVFGCIIAEHGQGWRQPVADRIKLLSRHEMGNDPIAAARVAA
jgi:hypothetical protein